MVRKKLTDFGTQQLDIDPKVNGKEIFSMVSNLFLNDIDKQF